MVVTFSTPVFVTLVAHKVLGERSGLIPILCATITLLGVGVISRPAILTGGKELFDKDVLVSVSFYKKLDAHFRKAISFWWD